jgi:hypothetical protein
LKRVRMTLVYLDAEALNLRLMLSFIKLDRKRSKMGSMVDSWESTAERALVSQEPVLDEVNND